MSDAIDNILCQDNQEIYLIFSLKTYFEVLLFVYKRLTNISLVLYFI